MVKKKKTLVLLDAHAIIHRAYHALPEFLSSKGEPTGALYGLSTMLMKIITDLKPDYIIACYDLPQKTFRHEAYEKYKEGRAKTDEALITQLKCSREIFEAFNIPIYDAPGFEADDVLGTIVEKIKKSPGKNEINVIIASGDMDTMQLIDDEKVQVYTLKKGINDTILYDEKKVIERFGFEPKFLPDFKGLRGDPSDNIIGIKGIGEKTATILVTSFGTIEEIYKKIKKDKKEFAKECGLSERVLELLEKSEEEAIFSKTLAKIRTDAPIEFKLPEKTFWESADLKKAEEVFSKFEFRSLYARLKNFFNNNGMNQAEFSQVPGSPRKSSARTFENSLDSYPNNAEVSISPRELEETSIALWLINSDITNPSLQDILFYAKTDSFQKAREFIFRKLKEDGLGKVFREIEEPIIDIVNKMEKRGILIDKKYFENLSKEYHTELDKLSAKIYEITGTQFNINSPKQLGEVIFGKMGMKSGRKKGVNGSFSTKVSVLEELAEENPVIKEILSYRELQKLLSTYIDVIPQMVGKDGRLHAKFLQNATTTGRFSSQNPNLQNLPIKTELGRKIRKGFIAREGKKLAAFDYSQIELRVAAILSQDKKMTQIFKEGKDIHQGVASFVFNVPGESVDSEMRRKAKVINFGIIYGMGVSSLRKSLGGTREEAEKFYENYFKQFFGVKKYLEEVKISASQKNFTETLFGRRRYFPNINSRIPYLKSMAERTAINAPIQGTATADIIKLAIRYAEEDLLNAGIASKACLILQIHDELVYEIDEEVLEKAQKIIKNAMESLLRRSYLRFKTDVPLVVRLGAGNDLGEVK